MKHSLLTPAIALAFLALHAGAVAQDVVAVDRFGRTYTADQIKADDTPAMMPMGGGGCPSPCAAGIFLLTFAAGSGFDDPARQEVARHTVPAGSQRHAFNTAALAPALYHYKVLVGDGLIGDGKLTIVR